MLESIFAEESFQPAALPPPKPSPRGEGGPAKPGRMRGRFGTQPFLVEKGVTDSRLDVLLLMPRWATRSPPHQSPSVTASPQGEASGSCSPTRKSVPNQGTYMGPVIAYRPEQCTTTAKTSERERAGPNPGGAGGYPPATLCVRAFSRESLDPRPVPGGKPPRRAHPAAVQKGPPTDSRGPRPHLGTPAVRKKGPGQWPGPFSFHC